MSLVDSVNQKVADIFAGKNVPAELTESFKYDTIISNDQLQSLRNIADSQIDVKMINNVDITTGKIGEDSVKNLAEFVAKRRAVILYLLVLLRQQTNKLTGLATNASSKSKEKNAQIEDLSKKAAEAAVSAAKNSELLSKLVTQLGVTVANTNTNNSKTSSMFAKITELQANLKAAAQDAENLKTQLDAASTEKATLQTELDNLKKLLQQVWPLITSPDPHEVSNAVKEPFPNTTTGGRKKKNQKTK